MEDCCNNLFIFFHCIIVLTQKKLGTKRGLDINISKKIIILSIKYMHSYL